jgi:uncharacterized protein (DUF4213/DUF364 family)
MYLESLREMTEELKSKDFDLFKRSSEEILKQCKSQLDFLKDLELPKDVKFEEDVKIKEEVLKKSESFHKLFLSDDGIIPGELKEQAEPQSVIIVEKFLKSRAK